MEYTYTYDANGNILTDSLGGVLKHSYAYDEAGQLARVNDAVQNKTFCYTYDNGGNLIYKKRYTYTTGTLGSMLQTMATYTYSDSNWKDRLTSYNNIPLSYDAIGNLTYFEGRSFTWSAGRQLEKCEHSFYEYSIDYKYNADGLRTQKHFADDLNYLQTTYDYIWADGKLVSQTDGTNVLYFLYDSNDSPIGFVLNDAATYLYIKNFQGDITGIANENGAIIVNYTYDEWGRKLSITGSGANTVGELNPLRYRGYYYDAETGYYYLQSRYYNPNWGRFINADVYCNTGIGVIATNMFTYCDNNPINYIDPDGFFKRKWHLEVTLEIAAKTFQYYLAERMAIGCESVDKDTPAFSFFNPNWVAWQKWHFNVNSTGDDSRDILSYENIQNAKGKLSQAQKAFNNNDLVGTTTYLKEAFFLFGKALHCEQDKITHNEKTTKVATVYIKSGSKYSAASYYFHLPGADSIEKIWMDSGYTNDVVGRAATEFFVLFAYLEIKYSYSGLLKYVINP